MSIIKGLGAGGAEHLLVDQLANRDRDRFENHVVYMLPYKSLAVPKVRDAGVPVSCLGITSDFDPRWVVRLVSLVRRARPDVIHVHSPLLASVVRLLVALRVISAALVYTEHNRWGRYLLPTRLANAITYGLDDAHVAVSEGVARSVPAGRQRDMHVILNGIDVEAARAQADRAAVRRELGVSDDEVAIVTVANLRREKDYPTLIAAAERVVAAEPSAVFLAVGQGPEQGMLEDLLASTALGDRFRFLGYRSDAIRVTSGCDVFTLSSLHEGFPLAMMEAMALGLPVVATAVGGIPEAVDHGRSGLIVPPSDPGALAEALLEVVRDEPTRRSLAAGSAARGATFDSRPAIERLEQLYVDVAARR